MSKRKNHSFAKRLAIDIAGFGMIIAAPFLGWLPGPGGIPLLIAGLGLLALNYDWAEKLLHNFDQKRLHYVDLFLMGGRKQSLLIDAVSILLLGGAVYFFFQTDNLIWQAIITAIGSCGFFTLILNQRRIDRFVAYVKKRKHKRK